MAADGPPSGPPQTNGLKRRLNAGRLGLTVDVLLPSYQRKDGPRGSVPAGASSAAKPTVNGADARRTEGVFRRSHSLQEFTFVSVDEFPDPPEPEEDLNARMELLFEEYRQVELGLIFKTTDGATPNEKADEQRRDRRSNAPQNERRIAGTSAQTPRRSRERGVGQERSSAQNCTMPRRDSPFSNTAASKHNQTQNSPSAVSKGFRTNRTASADRAPKAIGVNKSRCLSSVERLKDSVKTRTATDSTLTYTVNPETSVSIKERTRGKASGDLQSRKQHQNEAKLSKERVQKPDVTSTVTGSSSKSSVLTSNSAKEPSFEVNTEKRIEKAINRQISHHSNTDNSDGDKTNNTDSLSSLSDSPESFAPASRIEPSLRKGEGHGLSSRIPVPIRRVKSCSSSRLILCDSGVAITNNLKFG